MGDSEFAISPLRTDWGTPILACAAEVADRYRSASTTPPSDEEVKLIVGRLAAHITKLMNTKQMLLQERGRAAAQSELGRIKNMNVYDPPVEMELCDEDAIFVRLNLLISIKFWELGEANHKAKARLVAMGNRLFNRWTKEILNAAKEDYWSATFSMFGTRLVYSKATCGRRRPEGIDLLVAYLQVRLGGTQI